MRNQRFGGDKLRRGIAAEAARLKYEGSEQEYFQAKRKAARRFGVNPRYHHNLPSNGEIKDELMKLADLFEGDDRYLRLGDMRVHALIVMRLLKRFHPKLIGSVLKGRIRKGSDIDIHVFSNSIYAVVLALEEDQLFCEVEKKYVVKDGVGQEFIHIYSELDDSPIEVTLYSESKRNFPFMSSVTGGIIESATISEVETLLAVEHPDRYEQIRQSIGGT
jgi:predicted nucleotidyltransferase